jgi:hypothetical protein
VTDPVALESSADRPFGTVEPPSDLYDQQTFLPHFGQLLGVDAIDEGGLVRVANAIPL